MDGPFNDLRETTNAVVRDKRIGGEKKPVSKVHDDDYTVAFRARRIRSLNDNFITRFFATNYGALRSRPPRDFFRRRLLPTTTTAIIIAITTTVVIRAAEERVRWLYPVGVDGAYLYNVLWCRGWSARRSLLPLLVRRARIAVRP